MRKQSVKRTSSGFGFLRIDMNEGSVRNTSHTHHLLAWRRVMKKSNRARVIAAAAGAVLSGFSLFGRTADGATFTWTGATNVLNTNSNWSPVGVPTVNDATVFQATGQ